MLKTQFKRHFMVQQPHSLSDTTAGSHVHKYRENYIIEAKSVFSNTTIIAVPQGMA
jgi:hypothetical protein